MAKVGSGHTRLNRGEGGHDIDRRIVNRALLLSEAGEAGDQVFLSPLKLLQPTGMVASIKHSVQNLATATKVQCSYNN